MNVGTPQILSDGFSPTGISSDVKSEDRTFGSV